MIIQRHVRAHLSVTRCCKNTQQEQSQELNINSSIPTHRDTFQAARLCLQASQVRMRATGVWHRKMCSAPPAHLLQSSHFCLLNIQCLVSSIGLSHLLLRNTDTSFFSSDLFLWNRWQLQQHNHVGWNNRKASPDKRKKILSSSSLNHT